MSNFVTEWLFNRTASESRVYEWMQKNNLDVLYSIVDDKNLLFVTPKVQEPVECCLVDFISIRHISADVDWKKQWQIAASSIQALRPCEEGYRFDLAIACNNPSMGSFKICSGAGFGDFSHPTTQIMLDLMQDRCNDLKVLDIGCGSGILSLAASTLGAKEVLGSDTDSLAIEHSNRSLKINPSLKNVNFIHVTPSETLKKRTFDLVLINMILSEQKVAWESVVQYIDPTAGICMSGILEDEEADAASLIESYGYYVSNCVKKMDWIGFYLKKQKSCKDGYN